MFLENINKDKGISNREYVYRVMRENIMKLNLKPGECISEIDLGNYLQVSRTPIREAIVTLSEEKLIDVYPQKGSFIAKINLTLVEEGVFLRALCEKELLKIACSDPNPELLIKKLEKNLAYQKLIIELEEDPQKFFELDNEFHFIIFDYYNKTNIWNNIKKFASHFDRLRLIDTLERITAIKSFSQHQEIVNIIRNKKINLIDTLIPEHLYQFQKIIGNYKKKYPDYFL